MVQEVVVRIELVDMALHLTSHIVDCRVLRAPRIAIAIVGLTGMQEVVFVYRTRADCSPIHSQAAIWLCSEAVIWGTAPSPTTWYREDALVQEGQLELKIAEPNQICIALEDKGVPRVDGIAPAPTTAGISTSTFTAAIAK